VPWTAQTVLADLSGKGLGDCPSKKEIMPKFSIFGFVNHVSKYRRSTKKHAWDERVRRKNVSDELMSISKIYKNILRTITPRILAIMWLDQFRQQYAAGSLI
jgi:hypothetical protein